jgi:hypothetical protein
VIIKADVIMPLFNIYKVIIIYISIHLKSQANRTHRILYAIVTRRMVKRTDIYIYIYIQKNGGHTGCIL